MTLTRNTIKTYVIEDAIEFGQTIGSCKERRQLLYKSKKDPLLCECFICSRPFKDKDYPWLAFVKGYKNVFVCKRCGQQIQKEQGQGDQTLPQLYFAQITVKYILVQ